MSRAGALFLLIVSFLSAVPVNVGARSDDTMAQWGKRGEAGEPTIRLYFFWSETCPHCQKAVPFVKGLVQEFPWLEVRSFPLTNHPDNVDIYLNFTRQLGYQAPPGVPTFIFCGRVEVGFGDEETTGSFLRQRLLECKSAPFGEASGSGADSDLAPFDVPLFGPIDPTSLSLPVLAVVIAGLDAFNPCAFFVLMFLLSLLVHARDRMRMAVIGGIFVLTSGLVYFLFMTAWLNLFLVAGELRSATKAAALVAIVFAAINIKDYFWFQRGVSLTIPETAKPGLFARMRKLAGASSGPALFLGAIVLAISANTYELLCTAGFPMVFTRVLTLSELSSSTYYAYLVLYNVVYIIPLLGLATIFVVSLGSRKLQESEGRTLKLLSGLMMLGVGVILLIQPDWLSDIRVAVGTLIAAIAITVLIAGLKRTGPRARGTFGPPRDNP